MSNRNFNEISFCGTNYCEYNDYLHKKVIDHDAMWDDIITFIRIAAKNGYQAKIWCDGLTTVIEYGHVNEEFGDARLEWIGENEHITNNSEVEEG